MEAISSIKDLITKAGDLEKTDLIEASKLYRQVLKEDQLNERAYNRLMFIYRKLKNYNEELQVINEALKVYRDFYNKGKSKSEKVIDLSSKLAKSFGLIDKKGNSVYEPAPISTWEKRKTIVEKTIKANEK